MKNIPFLCTSPLKKSFIFLGLHSLTQFALLSPYHSPPSPLKIFGKVGWCITVNINLLKSHDCHASPEKLCTKVPSPCWKLLFLAAWGAPSCASHSTKGGTPSVGSLRGRPAKPQCQEDCTISGILPLPELNTINYSKPLQGVGSLSYPRA